MDKDLIMDQLRKIVQARGGKYKPKHELADVSEKYKNQYEDDGSIEFEKLRTEVAQKIAQYLFGASGIKELSAVPEDAIKKVMSKLSKARELQIAELIREDKYNMKALDILEKDKNKVKYLRDITRARDLKLGDKYLDLEYPELKAYSKFVSDEKVPTKLSASTINAIADMFYPKEKDSINKMVADGLRGGKKKRGPSKYNMFVKEYLKKHKGHTMSDASKAWKKK